MGFDYSFQTEEQFHIKLKKGDIGKYVILPGDPGRCELIAGYLDNPRHMGTFREFNIYTGTINGEQVTVCSSGVGGPSVSLAVEELTNLGAEVIIRVGTSGGIDPDVLGGDVVIPTGAIRFEGTSCQYAPIQFPAVPDFEVVFYLKKAAERLGKRMHMGIVQSKDSFYGQHNPDRMPVAAELNQYWEAWKRMGTLCSEMECSTLFVVGQFRRIKTGAVILVFANQERRKLGLEDPQEYDSNISVSVAVEAIRMMIADSQIE